MEKKAVRWNVANALVCVNETIASSGLKFKRTAKYLQAIERLTKYLNVTEEQVWMISITCDRYFERNDTTIMHNFCTFLEVSAMSIISWKKEIPKLVEKGILVWFRHRGQNEDFQPSKALEDSIVNNVEFSPEPKEILDDLEFISKLGLRYENRRREDKTAYQLKQELEQFEEKNKELDIVKRVCKEIKNSSNRFFLYDVGSDVLNGGISNLNSTICDMWDGALRYRIASEMMEERHELFKKGLLEFVKKGNLTEASFTLSEKGKKLLLGDKAFLFEETIEEKNLIKFNNIKSKNLFYSSENQKEIDNLKKALQEEKLKDIQARLKDNGMPIGIAILLHGGPGTGKTESVYQIAKATGRSIVHVDISESKSAWFGESEKRIKKIFTKYKTACETCKRKGEKMPILLLNEADALISKRKDSSSSNVAQTENAMQNILLEEIENLEGILIATTNLANNMDDAFERRFLFKIHFENPSVEAKKSIWMDKINWLDENQAENFAKNYELSGGQIDNIARKIAINEIISGERPDYDEINDMCINEKLEKQSNSRIGFAS